MARGAFPIDDKLEAWWRALDAVLAGCSRDELDQLREMIRSDAPDDEFDEIEWALPPAVVSLLDNPPLYEQELGANDGLG